MQPTQKAARLISDVVPHTKDFMNEKTTKIFFVLVVISSLVLVACETRPFPYINPAIK